MQGGREGVSADGGVGGVGGGDLADAAWPRPGFFETLIQNVLARSAQRFAARNCLVGAASGFRSQARRGGGDEHIH